MMSAIIANKWAIPSLNLSLAETRSPFPEKMRNIYGTSLLLSPPSTNGYEEGVEDLMTFSNSSAKQMLGYGGLEGDVSGMGHDNQSNGAIFPNFGGQSEDSEYIFDRADVRAIFLVLYTIVFCSCFFVLAVMIYFHFSFLSSWVFGEFMCKMFHFINSLSTTASVLILVVICIERYLAIIHPMTCKQMLTIKRLRITIVCVWILSAAISSPRFYYFNTIPIPTSNDQYDILCVPNRLKYDSKLMDMISMTVLFLIPLAIISILYTVIGIVLWRSSNTKMASQTPSASEVSSSSSGSGSGCSYKETTDNNIIKTVNLTLLPVSEQQFQTRPTTLHGVSPNSIPQMEKHSTSSSILPFSCLKCGNKSKSRKRHQRRCTRACHLVNGNGATISTGGNRACNGNRIVMSGGEHNTTCKVCQYLFTHHHHSYGINGPLGPAYEPAETMTTSFIDCCHNHNHQHHNENNMDNGGPDSAPLPNNDDGDGCTRDEATSSPVAATCCGAGNGAKCPRLKKLGGSQNRKTVNFSENVPPSPFSSKSCSYLDGRESSKTDPIVLVKFEKNKSICKGLKGGNRSRRSQCAILMLNTKAYGENREVEMNKCNGKVCKMDPNGELERDSPTTISSATTRFDCVICQPPGGPESQHGIDCGDEGNMNDNNSTANGRGGMHNCYQKKFSLERMKNLSVDSGIAGMPPSQINQSASPGRRSIIECGPCDQNFDSYSMGSGIAMETCTASCPSCGVSCGESYQVFRCHHHHYHQPSHYVPSSSKLLTTGPTSGVPAQSPAPPKRLRRIRIVRSSKYGTGALQSRRRIIRMLIVVVLAFALCHLPFHARKVWQYWSPKWAQYQGGSVFSTLFTPITFLIMYANSGINPILYAFMSKKFRMSFKDLLCCRMRHSLRISRNASVRSTHAVALSQTGL